MTVEYELRLRDIAALHEHFAAHSGTVSVRRTAVIQAMAAFAGVFFMTLILYKGLIAAAVAGGLVGLVVLLAWPSVHRSQVKKSVARITDKLYPKAEADGVLGRHAVTLEPEGFRDVTAVSETRHNWSGIRTVDVTRDYIFLFTTPTMAFVVPRSALSSLDEFLKSVSQYVGNDRMRRFDGAAA